MGMTMGAAEAKRNYQREYRHRNRDRINAQQKDWRARNQDKVKQYNEAYWEKKAKKGSIRLPWSAYGIDEERHQELLEAARSGKHDAEVLSAAVKADQQAAKHIVLSVKENLSYEALEAKQASGKIEMITLGRTDFYGARRLFFHFLDCALREMQGNNMEVENG